MTYYFSLLNLLIIISLVFTGSCVQDEKGSSTNNNGVVKQVISNAYTLTSPKRGEKFTAGDKIPFEVKANNDSLKIDSIQIFLGTQKMPSLSAVDKMEIPSLTSPGNYNLRLRIFHNGIEPESHSVNIKLLSDIVPNQYTYKVIRTYPHDIKAYTQGLEFHGGYLYESTGNKGESSLRKVDPETGEILKFRNLSSEFFGEGLTLLNNKIYQITYRSQVGFVYDVETFELQNKIYYQNKEGWGLSNDGENIIMSDGSHIIYFMDPTYFSVERKIEVFDNSGEVEQLNELELINGILYANLYTLNDIVMIDPVTGKVTGRIDMSGLLKPEDRHSAIDYFNGIAWDAENKRIFVTGKYWPKLYHVEFMLIP